ncbi:translocation/assembly module TamB domain-containing protein [Parasediminibacterium sp. JCM 36343]|uniref:translocation/assembly module TamB domain-containing protein n=1 Tax=Parasediminibacterium sp. JCM 36343 TaxID=3374279 RepID=UPI003978F1D9
MTEQKAPTKHKWLKITGLMIGCFLLLVIFAITWLQTASGKNFVLTKAVGYLQKKIGTGVKVGGLDYSIPNWIKLTDVVFIDKHKDTLLGGQSLYVKLDMLALIRGNIVLNEIKLNQINININRSAKDSSFNFQYIVDAFASKNPDTTSKKATQLSIGKVYLDSIAFKYNDGVSKLTCNAVVGHLYGKLEAIDLGKMNFAVTDFILNNTAVTVIDKSPKIDKPVGVDTSSTTSSPFNLSANNIDVQKLTVSYASLKSGLDYYNRIDTLQVRNAKLDLLAQAFAAKAFTLNNSAFTLVTNDAGVSIKDTVGNVLKVAAQKGWDVRIDNISLAKNNVLMDNNAYPAAKEGLDYNHLKLNNIALQTNGAHYHLDTAAANILSGTVLANDFLVKNIKGNIALDNKKALAKGFLLNTQNSLIAADAALVAPATKALSTKQGNSNDYEFLDAASKATSSIQKSYIGYSDVLFFIPSYKRKSPIDLKPTQKILFNGKADGTLKELDIALLDVATDDGRLQLNAKGKAENVMETKKLRYNVVVNKLYVNKTILSASMLQQLKKQQVNLPVNMQVNGTIAGGIDDVKTVLKLTSPFGLANINATVNNFSNVKAMQYNLDVTGNQLQTGKWIYQDSLLGLFTGNVKIKGSGTDYKKATIQTTAAIKSFVVKGYKYTNVNLNAALQKGSFTAKGTIKDENLATAIDLKGTVGGQYPTVKGHIALDNADLRRLHFTKDSIQILSTIFIDVADLNPKSINAVVSLDSNIIMYNGKRLFADSMFIKANAANDTTKLFVSAPFVQANMVGKYDYEHLPTAIKAFIQNNYLKNIPDSSQKIATKLHIQKLPTDTGKVVPQQMVFNAVFREDAIIKAMAPALVMDKPAIIHASFDNSQKDTSVVLAANIPSVFYNAIEANNIILNADGINSALEFNLGTNYVVAGGNKFYNATAKGNFTDNTAKLTVKTEDGKKKEFYAISTVIELLKDETKIHLSDSLLLNHEKWNVSKDNSIEIKNDGYIVNNVAINKNDESILIHNKEAVATSPILIKIEKFNLGDLLAIANQDSTMAGGILNVDASLQQPITSLPSILGTVGIDQLTYQKVAIGNVAVKTAIGADGIISVKGGISGPNNLTIDGGYNTNDDAFSISTEITQLNLKAVEAFSQGQIKRAKGNVHGSIFAHGTVSDPRWQGELVFDTTQLSSAMFGSLYNIDNQKIDFDYPKIGLYDFTITDSIGNKLVLDGSVESTADKDFALNLNVNTKNFVAVNTPSSPNSLVYGVAIVDAAMIVGGTTSAPDVSGNVTLDDKSDVHYVQAGKNNYKDDLKEVVRFINIDTIKSFSHRNTIFTSAADTSLKLKYAGIQYNLNLEVKEKASISVIMDPASGDELKIKGKAQLNAGVDENGILGLSGVYQLKEGSYNLSYQFIKRRFDLMDGSTITFSGDPLDAVADITAQYEVETSPKELLGNEVAENSSTLGSGYNTKVPFEVILKIKGPLTKPELSFDIKVKDNAENVNTALATTIENKLVQYRGDVSEMNKQVFALLILGRFIGDRSSDFFATNSSGGTTTNDAVVQSVSKFLAEAVNQIAADLIKGVDVNLDLKNYEGDATTNTAARTDLNVALSKQLMNDRLIVTVGKTFTIDGEDPVAKTQSNSNLQFLPDISTTYKLSKDGKYALKAYRKNQYEAILDGYFTETGVAFSLTMNYEKFKEILQKGRKKANK